MLEQSYTRHLILFFHNFWPTNVLPVPILVIIMSYWIIQSDVLASHPNVTETTLKHAAGPHLMFVLCMPNLLQHTYDP